MLNPSTDAFQRMVTSTYDVHNVCNLRCEGCSYFVTDREVREQAPGGNAYDAFFHSEAARGVNYPIFSGAEPSLNQAPLAIAARHWRHGAVFTNGTRRIDPDLPFRVVISVWGGPSTAERLRGGNTYRKALAAAAQDPRAIVFFTATRESVEDIPEVTADCARLGVPISFNLYSMSTEYGRRLREGVPNDTGYFRFSTSTDNLALRTTDRARLADLIDQAIERYPDIVMCTKALNDFMCRSGALHSIDPATGLARDCAVLNTQTHVSYNYDLSRDLRKNCCAPDFDCGDCRVLGAALVTLLRRRGAQSRTDPAARREFRELRRLMMRLYFDRRGPIAA